MVPMSPPHKAPLPPRLPWGPPHLVHRKGMGDGDMHGEGDGNEAPQHAPDPAWAPSLSPSPGLCPRPQQGGAPGPPDTLYIDIFPRTHTRDPRGTAKTPEKRGKTPQQPVPEESKTQPGRGGGGRGRREGVAPAGQGGPGKAPGGLGGRVGRAGRGGRGRRPPAHFLFLSWLASQSRPS